MQKTIIGLLLCLIWMSGCSQSQTEKTAVPDPSEEQSKQMTELSEREEVPTISVEKPTLTPTPDPLSSPKQDSVLHPTRIVSVGDSLTRGIGDSMENGGYIPHLENKLEQEPTIQAVEIVNYGVKGNRSDQLLARLDQADIRQDVEKADSIVVTIGGNDIMNVVKQNFTNLEMAQFKAAKKDYEQSLTNIFNKIRTYNPSAPLYLVGVYNPFSTMLADLYELDMITEEWNNTGKRVIATYDSAYFIDIDDIFQNSNENVLYTEDYFHPNDRGYELIATRIYNGMDLSTLGRETIEVNAKGDESQE